MSRSKTPPPLQKYEPTDKDLDRWRIIQLQHQALFRGRALSPSSGEGSPKGGKFQETFPRALPADPPKVPATLTNKLPPTLSHPLDTRYVKRKLEQVQKSTPMPRLEVDQRATEELINPGNTLLEEAEFILAKKQVEVGTDVQVDYEKELRKVVQSLHENAIREKSEQWSEERNSLISECAALETRKQQLEEALRKQTVVGGTKEAEAEIARLGQSNAEMRDKIQEQELEISYLKTTIDSLNIDLEGLNERMREKEEIHKLSIKEFEKRLTMTENEQIDTLTRDLNQMREKNAALQSENELIHKRWKGESQNLEDLYREAEVAKRQVAAELKEMETARKKLEREQELVAKQREELKRQRQLSAGNAATLSLQDKESVLPKNAEALSLYLEAVLNTAARSIIKIARGESTDTDTNPLKDQISQLMQRPDSHHAVAPQLQMMKRVLETMVANQGKRVGELEENGERQVQLLSSQLSPAQRSEVHTPKSLSSTLHRSLSPAVSAFPSLLSTARKEAARSVSPLQEGRLKSRLKDLAVRVSHSQSTPKFDQTKSFDKDQLLTQRKAEYLQSTKSMRF